MSPLLLRTAATEATMAKFRDRAFRWGSCDCGKIAAFHARKFGWKVPRTGTYRGALGARKYLASMDCTCMADLLDKIGFARIAPAFALTGDFLAFDSADSLGGIGIHLGGDKIMAFHELYDTPVVIAFDPAQVRAAWSILKQDSADV